MTAEQIENKIKKANINFKPGELEFRHNEIEICVDYIEQNEIGSCDYEKTEKLRNKVSNILNWGGFSTRYGSWILQKNYESSGGWNDRSSKYHY